MPTIAPDVITVDFESTAIRPRPAYPPTPVSFSIQYPGKAREFYAWGHPQGTNNCTKEKATQILRGAWRESLRRSGPGLLFHNGKFDYDLATSEMGMPALPWDKIHDTLFLLFLDDPHAKSLSLKESAQRVLHKKPRERDELRDWILKNVPAARRKKKEWGAYISEAPGALVGRYAEGDVSRTIALFNKLWPRIQKAGMLAPYDRERKLMPILLRNEQEGIRVNRRRLEKDIEVYQAALEKTDNWLRKRLRAPNLNIDADAQLADALERAEIVTEFVWTSPSKTHPEGQKSVSKQNLTPDMFHDWRVAAALGYRNRLQTCLGMFMLPWLEMARASQTGEHVYTNWNQVRQSHGEEKLVGARTGRLSSNPNFQNIVKNWKRAFSEGYKHPTFLNVPELPLLRVYFLPDEKSHLWLRRDQNQQELRILAHFENGDLMRMYQENPRLDIHALVQQTILEMLGIDLPRDPVKILNFGDIYGRGLGALAAAMHVSVDEAAKFRKVKDNLLPGVAGLMQELKDRAKAGEPLRTWGGRLYYCEDPKYVEKYGRVMEFSYKMLNYLIQPSGADITKEIVCRYDEHPKKEGRLLLTVHDEFDVSANRSVAKQEMALIREIIRSVELDVTMESDGEIGPSWGELSKFNDIVAKGAAA